jgi:diaminopimelate epimerase
MLKTVWKHHECVKYEGLGNDYLVVDPAFFGEPITANLVQRICDRHRGVGSDGLLVYQPTDLADHAVRIYNPDGSEAEKSGNGLRIFARFLWDHGYVQSPSFTVHTQGGLVHASLDLANNEVQAITVDMGKASFTPESVGRTDSDSERLQEALVVGDRLLDVTCVSVGNPHCVHFVSSLDVAELKAWGPLIEKHPVFKNRINVQWAKVLDRANIQVEIWERGAGYTLASGSSSCAVVSAARKRGLVDENVTVHMPGGQLQVSVDDQYNIRMKGPAQPVFRAVWCA